MSDIWQEPGEDELMMAYAQMMGGMPGNTPAQRMNYYQDWLKTISDLSGVPIEGLLTPTRGEPIEPFIEPINPIGQIYGQDDMYASIFQAIEEGMTPIEAAKRAREQFKWTPMDPMNKEQEFSNTVLRVATDYANEKVKNNEARRRWEIESANAAKGSPSALGFTTEYDAMGAPSVDSLMDQYMERMGRMKVGNPTGGPATYASSDPTTNLARAGRLPATAPVKPAQPATVLTADVARDLADRGATARTAAPNNASPVPWLETNATPSWQVNNAANQRFNEKRDKRARASIERRLNTAKDTKIRSEEGRRVMNTVMAMAAMLQGGFPE